MVTTILQSRLLRTAATAGAGRLHGQLGGHAATERPAARVRPRLSARAAGAPPMVCRPGQRTSDFRYFRGTCPRAGLRAKATRRSRPAWTSCATAGGARSAARARGPDRLFPLPIRARIRDSVPNADVTSQGPVCSRRAPAPVSTGFATSRGCGARRSAVTSPASRTTTSPGRTGPPVHLVTAYVPVAALPAFARAVAEHLTGLAPDQPVVVDVESWRDEPLLPDERHGR